MGVGGLNAAEEYARRLLRLHRMYLAQIDDSEQAEIVRNEMDELWPRIADADALELRKYASELNQFSDEAGNPKRHDEDTIAERILKILESSSESLSSDELKEKILLSPVDTEEFTATIARLRSAIEVLSNLHST
jgi:hypothetical protein